MNATPSVSQATRSSDPAQLNAPESAAQTPGAGGADFARALNDAGGKPARKHAAAKQHEDGSSGSSLPAAGNQPPLGPPSSQTVTPLPAAPAAAAQPINGSGPVAAAPSSVSGAGIAPGAAATNTAPQSGAAPKDDGGLPVTDMAAALADAALSAATPAVAGGAPAAVGSSAVAGTPVTAKDERAVTLPAAPAATVAKPGTSPGPAAVVLPATSALTAAQSDARPGGTRSSKTEIAAAGSGQTSTDGSAPANDPALTDGTAAADAAAQSVIASAMARDTNTSPDPSAPADDHATPGTDVTLQGVAAATGAAPPPVAAPAVVTAAHIAAASAAAGSAATAASNAAAMLASAEAAVVDKRHNSSDSSSSGVSTDGSTGAAQLLTLNTSTDATPVPTFKVAAGLDTPDFGQGLADRVSLMMDSNLTSAKLQVNPPALGPIEVRIALQGGHAQVWMSSHSAVTRDALESSAPKLREMLGSQGFGQVSVDISQRSFQERPPQPQAYQALPVPDELSGVTQTSASMAHGPSGLLDAYA